MICNFKGREVVDIEVDGIDASDYPDFCDAFASYAIWHDTGKPLTDDELEEFNEVCKDAIYDAVMRTIY